LLELKAPIKIAGNIHGQYYDLLRIFEYAHAADSKWLWMGNYVDMGKHQLETICLLLAYKIKYPENFFLLRGNHEIPEINLINGFFHECRTRYNVNVYKEFTDVFLAMPLAAIIDDKIFVVSGGLSPELVSMDQIASTRRPTDIPDSGLLCDLMWSDPAPTLGWDDNDRGRSYTFGPDIVHTFLLKFDLDLIVRGHEVVEDGYEYVANRQLVSLFSAPHYAGLYDNAGAIMSIDGDLMCSFISFH